jgi:hypothetical protein
MKHGIGHEMTDEEYLALVERHLARRKTYGAGLVLSSALVTMAFVAIVSSTIGKQLSQSIHDQVFWRSFLEGAFCTGSLLVALMVCLFIVVDIFWDRRTNLLLQFADAFRASHPGESQWTQEELAVLSRTERWNAIRQSLGWSSLLITLILLGRFVYYERWVIRQSVTSASDFSALMGYSCGLLAGMPATMFFVSMFGGIVMFLIPDRRGELLLKLSKRESHVFEPGSVPVVANSRTHPTLSG